jgi:hypothetical protein
MGTTYLAVTRRQADDFDHVDADLSAKADKVDPMTPILDLSTGEQPPTTARPGVGEARSREVEVSGREFERARLRRHPRGHPGRAPRVLP